MMELSRGITNGENGAEHEFHLHLMKIVVPAGSTVAPHERVTIPRRIVGFNPDRSRERPRRKALKLARIIGIGEDVADGSRGVPTGLLRSSRATTPLHEDAAVFHRLASIVSPVCLDPLGLHPAHVPTGHRVSCRAIEYGYPFYVHGQGGSVVDSSRGDVNRRWAGSW